LTPQVKRNHARDAQYQRARQFHPGIPRLAGQKGRHVPAAIGKRDRYHGGAESRKRIQDGWRVRRVGFGRRDNPQTAQNQRADDRDFREHQDALHGAARAHSKAIDAREDCDHTGTPPPGVCAGHGISHASRARAGSLGDRFSS
jgi:hypothetical protein